MIKVIFADTHFISITTQVNTWYNNWLKGNKNNHYNYQNYFYAVVLIDQSRLKQAIKNVIATSKVVACALKSI